MTEKIPTVKLGYLRNTVQDKLSRNHSEKVRSNKSDSFSLGVALSLMVKDYGSPSASLEPEIHPHDLSALARYMTGVIKAKSQIKIFCRDDES
jgi:hypothetical protein